MVGDIPHRAVAFDFVVRHHVRRIEKSEVNHHAVNAAKVVVDFGKVDQFFVDGGVHAVGVAVEELVDAGVDGAGGSHIDVRIVFVLGDHVGERAGIGADDSVLAPLSHGDFFQDGVRGHGDAIPGVVGGHVSARAAVDHTHAKRDGIVFAEEAFIEVGGGAVAAVFVAVGEKVFHQR